MPKYKVIGVTRIYKEAVFEANSLEEARTLARTGGVPEELFVSREGSVAGNTFWDEVEEVPA